MINHSQAFARGMRATREHPQLILGEPAVPPAWLLAMQSVRPAARRTMRRTARLSAAAGLAIAIALALREPSSHLGASSKGPFRSEQWEALADQGPREGRAYTPDPRLLGDATARLRQTRRACFRGLQQACAKYRAIILSARDRLHSSADRHQEPAER
jgi:hypothetical protein